MGSTGILIAQIFASIATLIGAGGMLTANASRRKLVAEAGKSGADAASVLSAAALSLLDPAREQVEFLRTELMAARSEILQLRNEIAGLRAAQSGGY